MSSTPAGFGPAPRFQSDPDWTDPGILYRWDRDDECDEQGESTR